MSGGNSQPSNGIKTSAQGIRLFKIKAAYGTHRAILASGRKLMQEAREARSRKAKERREAKALVAEKGRTGATLDTGSF